MHLKDLHKINYFGDLRNPVYYCQKTGAVFRYIKGNLSEIKRNSKGYRAITVAGKCIPVHQLIAIEFLNHTPDGHTTVVNHINGDTLDNRVCNLELVTQRSNVIRGKIHTRKTSGLPLNINWYKRVSKYQVMLMVCGKMTSFGMYAFLEAAVAARDEVITRVILNGEPLTDFKSDLITAKRFKK